MRYSRKPTVIEATQYQGKVVPGVQLDAKGLPFVLTLNGAPIALRNGDWVVQEPDGIHYYPIDPNVFAELYTLNADQNQAATRLPLTSEPALSPIPSQVETPAAPIPGETL